VTVFAIRHKPSGGYLPEKKGSGMRRGFTHSEPSIAEPPRLFRKIGDARMALRSWLEGRWEPATHYDEKGYPYGTKLVITQVLDRKAEDMEIVEVEFLIVSTEQLL
jgi:hypothetical protein